MNMWPESLETEMFLKMMRIRTFIGAAFFQRLNQKEPSKENLRFLERYLLLDSILEQEE